MSPEVLKTMIRRVTEEAWNKGNLGALDELYVQDIIRHEPLESDIIGLDAYKQGISDMRAAYSDLLVTIDELIVDGDVAAMRGAFHGAQTGKSPTFGIPATGKTVNIPYCLMAHFGDGRCVEEWMYMDSLGAMRQLGISPRSEANPRLHAPA